MFQKVILVGRLGKDPVSRETSNHVPVTNFSIATTERYKNRTSGETEIETEWHELVAWRGLAEIAAKFLKKGHIVTVEGKLKYKEWEDKDGKKRRSTEIVLDDIRLMPNKREEN